MRIAFDARMVGHTPDHGISRYAFEFLKSFKGVLSGDKVFVFIGKESFLKDYQFLFPFKFIETKSKWLGAGEQIEIPYFLLKKKISLFHSPSFFVPFFCPCAFLITIHDLNHLVRSSDYSKAHKFYYKNIIKHQLIAAFRILTVSNFTKKEIIRYYGSGLEKKISVTYNGVETKSFPKEKLENFRLKRKLPEEFCFCLFNGKKHKNIERLISVYSEIKTEIPLVVCGKNSKILRGKIPSNFHKFIFLESLSEEELFSCYSLCKFFLFPSLYEGFGLPPLEALASGAEVLSSNSSAMPEILRDNVTYFDPSSRVSMKRVVSKALSQVLVRRKGEPSERKEFMKIFSWSSLGEESQKIYEEFSKKPL